MFLPKCAFQIYFDNLYIATTFESLSCVAIVLPPFHRNLG
jgi:hypothetical protein